MIKRIGILTSGGDASGMNAAVRTAVRSSIHFGMEPYAIYRGYHGMIRGEIEPLNSRSVSGIIQRGGTLLKSARSDQFLTAEGQAKAVEKLKEHDIDAVLVIGGDGSFRGAQDLDELGVRVICIPATIDNDIACTDYAIGFDTAVNTVMDAVNKIRDTASSHERVYVVEVMGRHSGFIALYAGLAGGADAILIPEVPYSLDDICSKLQEANAKGKTHSIIMIAEGATGDPEAGRLPQDSPSVQVSQYVQERTGYETRMTILGHIQRGGSPTVNDRLLASRLAYHAIELLHQGKSGKMVGEVDHRLKTWDLHYALAQEKQLDLEYYHLSNILASI